MNSLQTSTVCPLLIKYGIKHDEACYYRKIINDVLQLEIKSVTQLYGQPGMTALIYTSIFSLKKVGWPKVHSVFRALQNFRALLNKRRIIAN